MGQEQESKGAIQTGEKAVDNQDASANTRAAQTPDDDHLGISLYIYTSAICSLR
jgi:hypothetical protein